MKRQRPSIGLDVHARSVVGCGLDGDTGEVFQRRLCPDHREVLEWVKRSHTAVTIDGNGRQQATKTVGTTTQDHLQLLKWATALGGERLWAIEDCRHMTRRLERDL